MAIKRKKYTKGVRIKPNTDALEAEGEITVDSADDKLKAQLGGSDRAVVTEDQTQTVTNKTIDADNNTISNLETDNLKAGVLVTDVSAATSDTEIPSALAVKTAVDSQNEASEISYDNTDSGLTATNVKAAIDEVDAETNSLRSLTNTSAGENNLGTFTGTTIPDNGTIKVGLQALETAHESHTGSSSAHGVSGDVVGTTDTQTLTNKTITGASIQTPSRLDVKQDTEANLTTYASTANDGQIVFATDTQKMYQIIGNSLKSIGGGGSTQFEVTQASHGFSVGEGIYHNGTNWVKGQADDSATLAYYVVTEVADANTFIAADFGRVEAASHGYTVGQYYFLSESTAGLATTTEPSTGFSNPLFYVEDANTLQIKCLRPDAIGGGVSVDGLSDVSAPAPTDGDVLRYNNANSRYELESVTGDIVGTSETQVLTNKDIDGATASNSSRITLPKASKSTLDGLTRKEATLVYASDEAKAYIDDGTNLQELGAGGAGGINYLDGDNSDAESSAGDWVEYADAADTVPVDGAGAGATVTFDRNTSSPLRGSADFLLTKDANNRQGEGASVDFTIDSADQAKKLTISFDYTTSANYADDDIKVFVYDITNANLIRVNGEDLKATSGNGTHYAQFQTAPDSTSYRLILHVSSASLLAYTVNLDNIKVGPTNLAYGTVITDWEDFTPVGNNLTLGNGTLEGKYRRVGDSLDVVIDLTFGSTTSITGTLTFQYPTGISPDLNKLQQIVHYGTVESSDAGTGANRELGPVRPTSVALQPLTFNNGAINSTDPFTWASGDQLRIKVSGIPVAGWSSNAQSSQDLGNREIRIEGAGNGGTTITANTTDIDWTETTDNTASWDGTTFTTPETGEYIITGGIRSTSAVTHTINAYINGTKDKALGRNDTTNIILTFASKIFLNKGDLLTFRDQAGSTLLNDTEFHTISIQKLASPQTILETETVAFKARRGTALVLASGNTLVYPSVDYSTHGNAYNSSTGEFTVPVSGIYRISGKFSTQGVAADAETDSIGIDIQVNGVRVDALCRAEAQTTSVRTYFPQGSTSLKLNKGDVIRLVVNEDFTNTINLTTNDDFNTFEVERIK